MVMETEIWKINVSEGCDTKCERCERYFDCNLQFKEVFSKRGILSLIRENLKSVKHKVVVLGGKGGVGKSMLTANLAAALAVRGKKVAILDQDYDCPSIPFMMGLGEDVKLMIGDRGLIPAQAHLGIKVISTGLILDVDEVLIWFHDMKTNATEELLCAVDYGETDYLVVDIPAGTSSETVNTLKYIPDIDGALVITAPSEVSQNVARKCIYMLKKAEVPIIGVLENMSVSSCPDCGALVAPIQSGAGERMAQREGVSFLGRMPTSQKVSSTLDEGVPFVLRYPESEESGVIMHIADAVISHCEGGDR